MKSHSATVLFALATMAAAPGTPVTSITHDRMPLGQEFVIETADEVYRGQLLDRTTGECQMAIARHGDEFSPSRTIYLLGATAGPQDEQTLVLMHEVKVGLKMELGLDDLDAKNRVITGEVKAIKFLR
jgi:hypothetical protein